MDDRLAPYPLHLSQPTNNPIGNLKRHIMNQTAAGRRVEVHIADEEARGSVPVSIGFIGLVHDAPLSVFYRAYC